jgi:predicted dehydrogenase
MRLATVWDTDRDARERFAKRFGVRPLPSLDDLLAAPLDLVCICTPNATHAWLAARCLEAGRDVLVEHPLATSLADARKLCGIAAAGNRRLFVMRQRRFLHSVQALRRCISRGVLGQVRDAEGFVLWSRSPAYFAARPWRAQPENGGVLLNQASHFVDILCYLFGEATDVTGSIGTIREDLAVEDAFAGTLIFRGVEVRFACTTAAPEGSSRARLAVNGSRAGVVLGGSAWEIVERQPPANGFGDGVRVDAELLTGDHAGYLERVRRSLAGEDVEVVSAEEDLRTLQAVDAIYRASSVDRQGLRARFERLFGTAGDAPGGA